MAYIFYLLSLLLGVGENYILWLSPGYGNEHLITSCITFGFLSLFIFVILTMIFDRDYDVKKLGFGLFSYLAGYFIGVVKCGLVLSVSFFKLCLMFFLPIVLGSLTMALLVYLGSKRFDNINARKKYRTYE